MTATVGALSRTRTLSCNAVARHSRCFRRRRDKPTTVFTPIGAISVIGSFSTEWLDDGQVDREALMDHLPNESIVRHGHPARMETGWVGLMKGAIYPDDRALGLVHRSPPIAGTGETRILFCLDA